MHRPIGHGLRLLQRDRKVLVKKTISGVQLLLSKDRFRRLIGLRALVIVGHFVEWCGDGYVQVWFEEVKPWYEQSNSVDGRVHERHMGPSLPLLTRRRD